MKNNNKKINLLSDYAIFLEETLKQAGYDLSRNGVLEITDGSFDLAADYLGCYANGENGRRAVADLRSGTEDILDVFLNNYEDFPDVNIVYAQMPFKCPSNLIHKLSLVPAVTPAIAVFGAYGFKDDVYQRENNFRKLNKFIKCLSRCGFDYDGYRHETLNSYSNLIISKRV